MATEKSCFTCEHMPVCKHRDAINNSKIFNVLTSSKGHSEIYEAVARNCEYYLIPSTE
jgi:hypothetical protein